MLHPGNGVHVYLYVEPVDMRKCLHWWNRKNNACPGLLAYIAIPKYQDALPLYRQQAVLQHSGVDIPRNTLAN